MSILNIRPNELNELSETLMNLLTALEEISALNPREIPAEQQGLHGTPTSPVSSLLSHQCQRRLTRANSIDTDTNTNYNILTFTSTTSTSKRNNRDERSAVEKLIHVLSKTEAYESSKFFSAPSIPPSSTQNNHSSNYGACGFSL